MANDVPDRYRCIGCGHKPVAGIACVACWPRLPFEIRTAIVRGNDDECGVALIEAVHWYRDNPIERKP